VDRHRDLHTIESNVNEGRKDMSTRELIDVVIPTYNETLRLAQAIDSCKSQTYLVNKIIIVDDGSDQSVAEWIRDHYANDAKVSIVLNDHTGLPGISRNLGVNQSNAEWIAFLDADDYWHPEKLEIQMRHAKNHGSTFVSTNAYQVVNDQVTNPLLQDLPSRLDFKSLVKTNWVVNSSVLVKRCLLVSEVGYATSYRVRAVEDYATWLRIAALTTLDGLDLPLTYYRISPGSIRGDDTHDPRIYALSDFLQWSLSTSMVSLKQLRKMRRLVLRAIVRQYWR
jgi:teichuronic acid biosynthesis glycosyltransferase TuaG